MLRADTFCGWRFGERIEQFNAPHATGENREGTPNGQNCVVAEVRC
jgi:hypothetical protein